MSKSQEARPKIKSFWSYRRGCLGLEVCSNMRSVRKCWINYWALTGDIVRDAVGGISKNTTAPKTMCFLVLQPFLKHYLNRLGIIWPPVRLLGGHRTCPNIPPKTWAPSCHTGGYLVLKITPVLNLGVQKVKTSISKQLRTTIWHRGLLQPPPKQPNHAPIAQHNF